MKFFNSEDIDFSNENNTDIVNHVLKKHHASLKQELPRIEKLIFTIYKVHFDDSGDILEKVHRLFGRLKTEFESHMIKEERSLFYLIRDYDNHPSKELLEDISQGMMNVEENNRVVLEIFEELREVTNGYKMPLTGCPTYEKAYNKIHDLEKDTKLHFNLEEEVMFKRLKDQ